MRTEHLEYLTDIYETQSFSKTAENFLTSHQVISKAMNNLENELNAQIFERAYSGVKFTDIGLKVYKYAKDMLESRDKMLAAISENNLHILEGQLNINIAPRFANDHFIDFCDEYAKKNPKLKVWLRNLSYNDIFISEIDNDTIILLPMSEYTLQSDRFEELIRKHELTSEIVLAQYLGYCVSVKSKYYQQILDYIKESGNAEELMNNRILPIVTYNYFMMDEYQERFYLIDNFEVQRKMVKSGSYISVAMPHEFNWIFKNDKQVEFIPKISENKFYYVAVYKQEVALKKQCRDFLDKLKCMMDS